MNRILALPARPILLAMVVLLALILTMALTGCGSARRVSPEGATPAVYDATPERLRLEYGRRIAPLPPGRTVSSFAILDPKTFQIVEIWRDGTKGKMWSPLWAGNDR